MTSEVASAGVEIVSVDTAFTALSWLISPLQRAEQAYLARLVADPDWPDEEIRARRAEIDAMPTEEAIAAILGWTGEPVAASDFSLGGRLFSHERVPALSAALAEINEQSLRADLDFEMLDRSLVPPDGWLEEGEAMFTDFVLPALRTLQAFFRRAADAGEAVLVIYV